MATVAPCGTPRLDVADAAAVDVPSGFATVAPCGAAGTLSFCAEPSGFAIVAPWVVEVDDAATVVPSGFATVACPEAAGALVVDAVAGADAGNPKGLATVAAGTTGAGEGATVADKTLEVILPAPAELGELPDSGAALAACAGVAGSFAFVSLVGPIAF